MADGDRGNERRVALVVVVTLLVLIVLAVVLYGHARLCYENRGYDLETCNES